MTKIPNKELRVVMEREAAAYKKVVAKASKYCDDITSLEAMVFNPTAYCAEMLPRAAHDLELPLSKLFDLYGTPVNEVAAIASQLEGEYFDLIAANKDGIYLDEDAVEEYITKQAVIKLDGRKEKVYLAATKVCKAFNELQEDLRKDGSPIHQVGQVVRSDYRGDFSINVPLILTLGR